MVRFVTAVALIGVVVGALALGGWWFAITAMLFIGMSTYEEFKAFSNKGHRPVSWPTWVCLVISMPVLLYGHASALVALAAMTFLVVAGFVIFRKHPRLDDLLVSITPLLTIVLPGMCLLSLLNVRDGLSVTMLASVFAVASGGDTIALYVGKAMGRTPLCPEVSPHKTVAGAVGGLIGSVIGAAAVWGIASLCMTGVPAVWHFLLLGLLGGVAGQMGDLFASLVKRHCEIKDFSSLFPGHGGALDRLDSILFVTVVVAGYCKFILDIL